MDKLTYIIRELLIRQEKVFLPGIGVLTMQRIGSEIDLKQSRILPPREEMDFLPSRHIQPDHFEKQFDRLVFPDQVNTSSLKKEVMKHLLDLAEGRTNRLCSLLTFEKGEEGEFNVQISDQTLLSPLQKLPILEVPISAGIEEAPEGLAVVNEPSTSKDKKKSNWRVPALLTAVLLLLSFALWWYTPEWRKGEDAFSKLLVKERVNVSPSEVKTEAEKNPESKSPAQHMGKTPLIISPNGEEEDSLQKSIPPENENPLASNTRPEKEINSRSESKAENCVIVVGSFSRSSNVEKMKERLENDGHKVFTQNINGLTRVGLYTSCAQDPLDSVLSDTRKKIEEAAWLLEE